MHLEEFTDNFKYNTLKMPCEFYQYTLQLCCHCNFVVGKRVRRIQI